MKILILLFSLVFLYPALPREGDWVCTAEPIDESNTCTAFDYDVDRDEAKRKALEFCVSGCEAESCKIVRCMVARRE